MSADLYSPLLVILFYMFNVNLSTVCSVYTAEALLKIIGFGIRKYFLSGWNVWVFLCLQFWTFCFLCEQTTSVATFVRVSFIDLLSYNLLLEQILLAFKFNKIFRPNFALLNFAFNYLLIPVLLKQTICFLSFRFDFCVTLFGFIGAVSPTSFSFIVCLRPLRLLL